MGDGGRVAVGAEPLGDRLGDGDGPVAATRAPEGDGEVAATLRLLGRQHDGEEGVDLLEERRRHVLAEHVGPHVVVQAREGTEVLDPVGVRQEPAVQHDVDVEGQAVLVAERDHVDVQLVLGQLVDEEVPQAVAQLVHVELAGHPPGNLLLAALVDEVGDLEAAAAVLGDALGVTATVVPTTVVPVDLVGLAGGGAEIVGQVAVESAGGVTDVRLEPPDPDVSKTVVAALAGLGPDDLVVLGPGSFLGSVVAAVAAPRLGAAIGDSAARRVLVHNLFSPSPVADRISRLAAHGVPVDVVVVQEGQSGLGDLSAAGALDGVQVVRADVARGNGLAHDVDRLSAVLRGL